MKSVLPFALVLLLAGCANSFGKVRDTVSTTPDWYKAAREEIRGEGYPELSEVPELARRDVRRSAAALTLSREQTDAARLMFREDPRAVKPIPEPSDVRALAAEVAAALDRGGPVPTGRDSELFLTQADIDRIRAIFARAERR